MEDILSIDSMLEMVKSIHEQYKDNMYIQTRLSGTIKNLQKQMETSWQNHIEMKKRKAQEKRECDKCIQNFHVQYTFFYHITQQHKVYLLYTNHKFQMYDQNDFLIFVYDYINHNIKKELLLKHRKKIESKICKMVESQLFVQAIPTSKTIQSVLALLYPIHFKKKEYVKLFLLQLGKALKKADNSTVLLMSDKNKLFVNYLIQHISTYFGIIDTSSYIKYNSPGESNTIFLPSNTLLFSHEIIYSNIIEITAVSCHYATRFKYEDIISKCNEKVKTIIRTFDSTDALLNQFIDNHLKKRSSKTIHKKDVFFLWKVFEHEKLLPCVFTEKRFHTSITANITIEDKTYINLYSPLLDEVYKFITFIEASFNISNNRRDEYDIDEILNMYVIELSEEINYINVDIAYLAIEYYMNMFQYSPSKVIFAKCQHWSKFDEVHKFIMNYSTMKDVIQTPYQSYLSYTNSDFKYKVNKGYFEMIYQDIHGTDDY